MNPARPRQRGVLAGIAALGGAILALALATPSAPAETEARLESVERIWDVAPHNAFTDLAHHRGAWWCVFREGQKHVSSDGAIRVLRSRRGSHWTSAARVEHPDGDLRDPKLVIRPDGRFMLVAALARPTSPTHQSLVWFSRDGSDWGAAVPVGDPDCWMWRVTWDDGRAYGLGYGTGGDRFVRLYCSLDAGAEHFETLVPRLLDGGYPNETALGFEPDGRAVCLVRRDGTPSSALLGAAMSPYREWTWRDTGVRVGGPQMVRLPDGRWVAAVRLYEGGVRTALAWVDPKAGTLTEFLALPSGGDTSYAGMVWRGRRLWMSYYSSHEGRTAIYLAKVRLPARPAPASR